MNQKTRKIIVWSSFGTGILFLSIAWIIHAKRSERGGAASAFRDAGETHGKEHTPGSEWLRSLMAKKRRFEMQREIAKTEKLNAAADIVLKTDWKMFEILSVNKQFNGHPARQPLERLSEALGTSGVTGKRLAVVIVPGQIEEAGSGQMKPKRFNFVQALATNGFSEIVMEACRHGQTRRVDPRVFGF